MAGVPFENIERLRTTGSTAAARELLAQKRELVKARDAVEHFFQSRERLLSEEAFSALRRAFRLKQAPVSVAGEQPAFFTDFVAATAGVAAAESKLETVLADEVNAARVALWDSSRKFLPRLLIFGLGGVQELLDELLSPHEMARRISRGAERERHLLLYLQRVATKNDAFSEFGPTSWGKVNNEISGLRLEPRPGIVSREVFLERWTASVAAAAMNADPEIFPELLPRPNPNGRLADSKFLLLDSGEMVELSANELELIRRCDGLTPACELCEAADDILSLVERKVLRCQVEAPALEPHAFTVLRDDVSRWRPGIVRERWLSRLQPLAEMPEKFARETDLAGRRTVLNKANANLKAFGIERKTTGRALYSAGNPIGEETMRVSGFEINEQLINEVAIEAEPWIDFWRDTFAFIAARVAAGLRMVLEKAPGGDSALPLPAFLRACEMAKLPLTGPGLVGLAVMAFQEVKAAFRERMKPHAHLREYELTAADCHFVRDNFRYEKFDEFTFPSADLQLAAKSPEAAGRGEYQWILAELHPPAALLHHGAYWSCPDFDSLKKAFRQSIAGKPNFHFGFFAADFTAHTAIRIFDALPEFSYFVAPQRGNPAWKIVPPAEAEVYVDEKTNDVRLRHARTKEDLGSFARNWIIPLGFHPFQFGMAPQMPRLRCGKVIVQRRAWSVTKDELGAGDFSGISRDLVVAMEKLRAMKDWPRYVYIRPTEQALRRSGAEGRDKDTKPVFIDLESYLFLEIFHRWLTKAGELEVTEMLPAPDELCWIEKDGRRTFELRTLIVPRA